MRRIRNTLCGSIVTIRSMIFIKPCQNFRSYQAFSYGAAMVGVATADTPCGISRKPLTISPPLMPPQVRIRIKVAGSLLEQIPETKDSLWMVSIVLCPSSVTCSHQLRRQQYECSLCVLVPVTKLSPRHRLLTLRIR